MARGFLPPRRRTQSSHLDQAYPTQAVVTAAAEATNITTPKPLSDSSAAAALNRGDSTAADNETGGGEEEAAAEGDSHVEIEGEREAVKQDEMVANGEEDETVEAVGHAAKSSASLRAGGNASSESGAAAGLSLLGFATRPAGHGLAVNVSVGAAPAAAAMAGPAAHKEDCCEGGKADEAGAARLGEEGGGLLLRMLRRGAGDDRLARRVVMVRGATLGRRGWS
jgi:hypothetical protein